MKVCGFCGEGDADGRRLVAAPSTFICERCIPLTAAEAQKYARPEGWRPRPAVKGSECCSFCSKTREQVWQLIAGARAYICDDCIGLASDMVTPQVAAKLSLRAAADERHCSFCGARSHAVKKLVAGGRVDICDFCIEMCGRVFAREVKSGPLTLGSHRECGLCGHEEQAVGRPGAYICKVCLDLAKNIAAF